MAKLTNRYDVVQMGDTPDFWSGVADRLEQYLDPEFQMKLRQEKEEKRRYKEETNREIGRQHIEDIMSLPVAQRGPYINELKKDPDFMKNVDSRLLSAYEDSSDDAISFSNSMSNWRTAKTPEDRITHWNEMINFAGTNPNFQEIITNQESQHNKYLQKAENKKVVKWLQKQYPDILSEADIALLGDISEGDIDILTTKVKNSLDKSKASEERKQKLVKTFLDYGKALGVDASDQQLNTARALEAIAFQLSMDYLPTGGEKKDISYGIQPTFDINQVRDNDLVELGGQKLSGKRLKEILAVNPISDEELSQIKISRLGSPIGIGRKQDPKKYNPTLLGSSIPSLKELRKEAQPVNIATKKQIDKAAKDLGWNNKLDPNSIKFQLILEELEKRFPNYNFQANQIESD
jgi:hypothetical protein